MWELILCCVVLTSAVLFYVFRPLILSRSREGLFEVQDGATSLKRLLRKKETIYENIKDLEFEYKMGKFAEEDFVRLRNELSREAYEVMSSIDAIQPEPLDKPGRAQVVAVLKSGEKPKR